MTAQAVQTDYRRHINPFVAGQIADGRKNQFDTGRLIVDSTYTRATLPFGRAVGLVDNPVPDDRGTSLLGSYACANHLTTSGTGANTRVTNFGGVSVRNVALPGANTRVAGVAEDATNAQRVADAYNANDLVSIGSEGDYVVEVDAAVTRLSAVTVNTSTAANTSGDFGKFSSAAAGITGSGADQVRHASVAGCIYMTDSYSVNPYGGGSPVLLAVLRVRMQPMG